MADKIYRVNMSDLTSTIEDVPESWAGLGGRGLTSTIVAEEVPPTCEPLGKHNKLVFAPGLLTGTIAANSGRLSVGSKSPLTGGIKESNSGGTAAQFFARLGVKALIIEGKSEKDVLYCLHVKKDGVEISEVPDLKGKGNFDTVNSILTKLEGKTGVISIGPAGEMKMAVSNISVKDPDGKIRSVGRGGLGAVMGSKNVKCIAIDPAESSAVEINDPEAFKAAAKVFAKALVDHPVSGQGLPTYGTAVLVNIINEAGGLPTRNFSSGQFEGAEKISGETMLELMEERGGKNRHGCHPGCVIRCSQVYNDADKKYLTSGFEYESIWAMGADCCVDNLDQIAEADRLMDDIGIDTIETSVTFGVAMEGGLLPFGDGAGMLKMIKDDIGMGTPLGRLLGSGAGSVGKAYGVTRVPVVKNQAIPAYDPRAVKGIGITYATSTMGADHTAGYAVTANVLNVGGSVDPLKKEGQVELSRNLQIATAAVDTAGLCIFVAFAALDIPEAFAAIVDMLNARFGLSLTADDVNALGMNILKTERSFNLAAGLTNKDDRLPEFFSEEPLPPHNVVWDFTGEEIDAFWDF
ncbi:aldehyde ferredoxin oxidoreductase family protein [Thermodesulfobacteriota bacterium]